MAKTSLTLTAFGETKTHLEWVADKRCKCSLSSLRRRLAKGMEPEEALATPPQHGAKRKYPEKPKKKKKESFLRENGCYLGDDCYKCRRDLWHCPHIKDEMLDAS